MSHVYALRGIKQNHSGLQLKERRKPVNKLSFIKKKKPTWENEKYQSYDLAEPGGIDFYCVYIG